MTAYCYCFGKRFINALFLVIYSLVLLRFVSVLLKRIDCILFSALLAHLHTNICVSNTQIKHYVLFACCFCVSFPSFFHMGYHQIRLDQSICRYLILNAFDTSTASLPRTRECSYLEEAYTIRRRGPVKGVLICHKQENKILYMP